MSPNTTNRYALITGASKGLGRCFALELAKKGYNTILVSLPSSELHQLNEEIKQTYAVDSVCFEFDLTNESELLHLTREINRLYPLSVLINNAGIGGTAHFSSVTPGYLTSLIHINVVAPTLLTHQLLPNLIEHGPSYILNVSSLAAFSHVGYKTVYPASKSFVHAFSRGLNEELKGKNVTVSVVNPGAMATNPDVTARIAKQGLLAKIILLDPHQVAQRCVNQMLKNKSVIRVNPISSAFLRLLPSIIKIKLGTRAIRREIEKTA
jgi:short-subunit dehydrogenase